MYLQSVGYQQARHSLFCADGSIASGGVAQLVLPVHPSRASLTLQNISTGPLYFEFGSARAHATLTSGAVTSVTIDNGGFNFTKPPVVEFMGGGNAGNSSFLGLNQVNGAAPNSTLTAGRPAKGHATISGGAVNAIIIDDPGAGYVIAPFVFIYNADLDPYGCAAPAIGTGMLLPAGTPPIKYDGTTCFTDSVAVYGATTGQAFFCRWMP